MIPAPLISLIRQPLLALLVAFPCIALPGAALAQTGGTTLNLKDAEINSLITTVSELTGVNFIVDPRVKGKVTVLSASPMSPDELYSVFLAVLQVHGFAAVPAGPVTKIVPEVGAKQDGGSYFEGDGLAEDEILTRVMEVTNVPAAQLVPILRPLVPQYGHLAAYSPSNMLIISDRASNVKRLTEIIRRIDQATDSELEVIRLQYASAADVLRIVQGLTQSTQQSKQAAGQEPMVVLADERTNSMLISGDKSQRLTVRALIADLDIPLDDDGDTQVIYLSYANAEALAPILEGYVETQQAKEGGAAAGNAPAGNARNSQSRIVAEPDTNALIITASPKIMRGLKSVIAQLDIRRAQVLVEGILAEVSVSKARDLGVDWAVYNEDRIAAASILNSNVLTAAASAISTGTPTAALSALGQGFNLAGGRSDDNGTTFGALLNVLYGDGDTNVLSTPSLVTMDNEEAEISVGQEVPFLTGSFTNTGGVGGAVNPFQTIQRQDVGLTLSITPQINEGDSIQLKIRQESSNVSAGSAGAVDLVTNKRTLETTVMIDDGDILVLGGLIDDNVQQTEQKVPLLGDIPILGALFRSTSVNKTKQNLMLFIRPTILRDRTTANYYTRRKYNYMRSMQSSARNTRLLWGDRGPQLSPLEDVIRPRVLDTLPGGSKAPATKESDSSASVSEPTPAETTVAEQIREEATGLPTAPTQPLRIETEPVVYGDEDENSTTAPRKKMGRGHLR